MSKRRKKTSNRKTHAGQLQPGEQISFDVRRPDFNDQVRITVVPEFAPTDPRSAIARPPEGSSGTYKVMFILATPGKATFTEVLDVARWMKSGESLLLVPKGTTRIKVDIRRHPDVREMWFTSNAKGALDTAEIAVEAASFIEAEGKAYDTLAFQLSWWSYKYSVVIGISGYQVIEERTDSVKYVFNALGREQPLKQDEAQISTPKFRRVLSAYREAIGAGNVFYRVICLFNVLEGLYKIRNQRLEADRLAGREVRDPGERIESTLEEIRVGDDLHRDAFTPYLGWKFTKVRDELRGLLRNAVAHLDPSSDDSLIADEFEDLVTCSKAVPVIKYMCDVMLNNEIRADPELAPDISN